MTIKFTPDGKVDRHLGTVPSLRDYHDVADALDECVAALHIARWALREPINNWKGECERKALDSIRDALRKIGAEK